MKTTIYDLLSMIKDGKFVKRVLFRNRIYEYDEDGKDYFNEEDGWLLDGYSTLFILNEPIEILETTLNTKDMNITSKKIEKINFDYYDYDDDEMFEKIKNKINEIIDVLNNNK